LSLFTVNNAPLQFGMNNVERMRLAASTGNVLINTTTDAGFKLDVNGTARVVGNSYFATTGVGGNGVGIGTTSLGTIDSNQRLLQVSANLYPTLTLNAGNGTVVSSFISNSNSLWLYAGTLTNHPFLFATNDTERMRIGTTGNILINTTTDVASSKLTIQSTTQGFLPPRMTTTQKNAIASPAEGLQVWDTTLKLMSVYNGTTWITL
jgi:hypothetical protein